MATEDAPEFLEQDGFLEARFRGQFHLVRIKKEFSAAIAACQAQGVTRLLLDLSSIIGFEQAGTTDRFEMGSHAAQLAGGKIAVAVLGLVEHLDPERFGMRVAQNRGMRIEMFTAREGAVAWLTGLGKKPE